MTEPLTAGVHHVGPAVQDLHAAERFFVDALGWTVTGGVPSYPAVFVSDGTTVVTPWRVANPEYNRIRFYPDVTSGFAPGPMREKSPFHHFIGAMPGGVRLEVATIRS